MELDHRRHAVDAQERAVRERRGALEETHRHYRRDYWRDLDDYVEVWLEKDALAGVLYRVTDEWGVPLMVTRGFASLSYIHNAAETIARIGKPTHI